MTKLGAVLEQLKEERSRLDRAISALSQITRVGLNLPQLVNGKRPKRQVSQAARRKMAAAQRARWSKVRAGKRATKSAA